MQNLLRYAVMGFKIINMNKILRGYLFGFLLLFFSFITYAQGEEHEHGTTPVHSEEQTHAHATGDEENPKDIKSEIKEIIHHHLLDSHDFVLYHSDKTGEHLSIPLPVILWDDGLHIFLSSKFDFGHKVVESNGKYYKLYHSKIYRTDKDGTLHFKEGSHYPTDPMPLDLSITKTVLAIILMALLMLWMFGKTARSYDADKLPHGIGRFLEPLVVFVRDEIARPNIGEKHYKKYMPFLLTVFFFIWGVNLLGLTPFGFNVTGNITITFALAILTYLITTFTANKNYWKHIFWMPGVPTPMKLILAPIELFGTFIKPFSLMIRLYANILAGHTVLMSIIGLIFIFKNWVGGTLSFGLVFALSLLELLVAALQAYIFTMLSALYFGMAKEEHHDEEH